MASLLGQPYASESCCHGGQKRAKFVLQYWDSGERRFERESSMSRKIGSNVEEDRMAMTGVLRPGYIQIRVLDMDAALSHYIDRYFYKLPPDYWDRLPDRYAAVTVADFGGIKYLLYQSRFRCIRSR